VVFGPGLFHEEIRGATVCVVGILHCGGWYRGGGIPEIPWVFYTVGIHMSRVPVTHRFTVGADGPGSIAPLAGGIVVPVFIPATVASLSTPAVAPATVSALAAVSTLTTISLTTLGAHLGHITQEVLVQMRVVIILVLLRRALLRLAVFAFLCTVMTGGNHLLIFNRLFKSGGFNHGGFRVLPPNEILPPGAPGEYGKNQTECQATG